VATLTQRVVLVKERTFFSINVQRQRGAPSAVEGGRWGGAPSAVVEEVVEENKMWRLLVLAGGTHRSLSVRRRRRPFVELVVAY
jgi:hypothetical protein